MRPITSLRVELSARPLRARRERSVVPLELGCRLLVPDLLGRILQRPLFVHRHLGDEGGGVAEQLDLELRSVEAAFVVYGGVLVLKAVSYTHLTLPTNREV